MFPGALRSQFGPDSGKVVAGKQGWVWEAHMGHPPLPGVGCHLLSGRRGGGSPPFLEMKAPPPFLKENEGPLNFAMGYSGDVGGASISLRNP